MAQEPARVAEISRHVASGVWSAWLENGARAHYVHRDGARFAITVTLAGGELHETEETRGLSAAAAAAWSDGTGARAAAEREGVIVEARATGDAIVLTLTGESGRAGLAFDALRAMLTDARIDAGALASWRSAELVIHGERATDAQAVFRRLVSETLHPERDPRTLPVSEERVRAIVAESALTWLRLRLTDSPVEMAVAGGVTREVAFEGIVETIGRLAARERIGQETLDGLRQIERPRGPLKGMARAPSGTKESMAMRGFFGADLECLDDVRALHIGAEALSQRLPNVLKEAGADEAGVRVGAAPGVEHPGFGLVWVAVSCTPGSEGRVLERIDRELDEFARAGPTAQELETARARLLEMIDRQLADPSAWSARLAQMTYRGHTPEQVAGVREGYATITAARVREAFARHEVPEAAVRVVVRAEP
ncbi:MAG: insulinase family protein [Phycisphaeraceae bacterium]|nr:insulinase family protein [Phycisphaeraceae bacterium]